MFDEIKIEYTNTLSSKQTEYTIKNTHTQSLSHPSCPAVEHIKKQLGRSDLSVSFFRLFASAATRRVQLLPSGLSRAGGRERATLLQREEEDRGGSSLRLERWTGRSGSLNVPIMQFEMKLKRCRVCPNVHHHRVETMALWLQVTSLTSVVVGSVCR